ncbi:hypothetical protein SASPL_133159 [Salvia splendens]|uniref:Uncharacterized protein n=2 Tax=Salvia splendens TaxID=180675 RepID=A0A8X8ZI60_SALSN|nr:hypothetical protein SASPL_133159 [Salvia splendens]
MIRIWSPEKPSCRKPNRGRPIQQARGLQRGRSCLKSKQRTSQRQESICEVRSPVKLLLFLNPLHKYICLVLGPIEMDPSKIGTEECSSSESGWTTYIASPNPEDEYADQNEEDDDDDDDDDDGSVAQKGFKKVAREEAAADSDDSMASDASSGPTDQYYYLGRSHGGFIHAGRNNQRKWTAKKQEEKKKQIKGEKDKSGNSARRLKKF